LVQAEAIGAKKIFSKRLGVALLRYTTGTLCYDELIVGVPVRIGLRPYMWIRDIWVSDIQSQAGGIHIWNLPKLLATFTWNEETVTIDDADGLIAQFCLNRIKSHWPWGFAFLPIAGSLNGRWRPQSGTDACPFANPLLKNGLSDFLYVSFPAKRSDLVHRVS